jgi:hypothetical protein
MNKRIGAKVISILFAMLATLTLVDGPFSQAIACDYYASPNGGGNGLSQSSPFRIANFWKVAAPGKTLCLLDGVYSDPIKPPENLNGRASARITVKALNDGKVRIDGGGVVRAVQLKDNDYFVIEGINAHNNRRTSVILFGTGADNNILRRVCAWDGPVDTKDGVMGASNPNTGNLFEDVCAFGSGRKMIGGAQGSTNHVIRRAWARWESNTSLGPKATFSRGYNAAGQICENCIGTWDGIAGDQPQAIFRNGPARWSGSKDLNPKYYGSIAYVLSSQKTNLDRIALQNTLTTGVFKDVVVYTEHSTTRPLKLVNLPVAQGGPCVGCFITNTTSIGGPPSSLDDQFQRSNVRAYSSISEMVAAGASPWQATSGVGARVCKRYVNGYLTDQPLWPWPMNQRIIDAMRQAGKAPVDVTQTMEKIFGPIPSECGGGVSAPSSGAGSVPDNPVHLNVSTGG